MCETAASCSCEAADDVKIVFESEIIPYTFNPHISRTVGLYNECKCNFWYRLCEVTRVGEACDYAAESCCGDYSYRSEYFFFDTMDFHYWNSPACYCDFINYAQKEFGHVLKPKAFSAKEKEWFLNACDRFEYSSGGEEEKASLEAIYNNANGPDWVDNDGWMNETLHHCQWYGISCNDEGHITSIELRDNNLAGQFPVYTRKTDWGEPADLESESYHNKYGLANLHKLEMVDLGYNKLQGAIEYRSLYNLPSLRHFDISGNQLSGEIDALVTPVLTYSDFSNNNFNSMRRFDKYKGSYLTILYCNVSDNAIKVNASVHLENIPPNIEQIYAQNNQIYGRLPKSITNLRHLEQFDMSSNALTGNLPESINGPNLRYFNMSYNTLSGLMPDFSESLLTLQELDFSNQKIGFTGTIPENLRRFQSFKVLNLAGNKLEGTIPPFIGNMAALEVLDLSNNLLQSSIPPELGLLEGEYHCLLQ